MSEVAPRFRELSDQLGGFSDKALESLVYFNNPFELYHWTMNVVELLLIGGAVWGLMHAIGLYKKQGNVVNLGVWIASVVFMLAVEIPVYFPEKIGGDANAVLFLHNEFTLQFFYDRAPLYIMALYPALMYPSYVLVDEAGVFERRGGLLLGALATGFTHHVFYEIFDHFGPQYGWWVWNYPQFISSLKSVPVSSMYGFAFMGPLSLVLMVRSLLAGHARKRVAAGEQVSVANFSSRTGLAGVLTPVCLALFMPQTYFAIFGGNYTPSAELGISFAVLAVAGLISVSLIAFSRKPLGDDSFRYAHQYFALYLGVFVLLWLYALPDYFAAVDGVAATGGQIGSLPYALGCFVIGGVFAFRGGVLFKRVKGVEHGEAGEAVR